jgi:hypothetical protein
VAQLQTLYPRRDTKHYGPLEPPWCTGDTLRTSAFARVLRRGLYEPAVYSIPRFSADYQDLILSLSNIYSNQWRKFLSINPSRRTMSSR